MTDYGRNPAASLLGASPRRQGSGARGLPGGTCEVGGDDIGRMPVKAAAGAVVSHRGPRVGMRGGLLNVPQRHSGVERGG